jgi:hypothetical protein
MRRLRFILCRLVGKVEGGGLGVRDGGEVFLDGETKEIERGGGVGSGERVSSNGRLSREQDAHAPLHPRCMSTTCSNAKKQPVVSPHTAHHNLKDDRLVPGRVRKGFLVVGHGPRIGDVGAAGRDVGRQGAAVQVDAVWRVGQRG